MDQNYLIPANSKKSMLIFGLFTSFDLVLFLSGLGVTLILLLVLPIEQFTYAIVALLPALICTFLIFPVPNYHNVLAFLKSAVEFFTTEQKLIWRGWCYSYGEKKK